MTGKPRLLGALAEAFGRVERDVALLYGAGYWTLEEWVQLDGLLHKGEYFFTNGPGNALVDFDSPVLDQVTDMSYGLGKDIEEDLLVLDDYGISSSMNSAAAPEPTPSLKSSEITQVDEDEEPISTTANVQDNTEPQVEIEPQVAAPPSTISQNAAAEANVPQQIPIIPKGPKGWITPIHMHPILSNWAPELCRPFTNGEKVQIKLKAHKCNRSMSSAKRKILQMEKGDLIELTKFYEGHRFYAKNLRTREWGLVHEEIFFPIPWPSVVGILDEARSAARRNRKGQPLLLANLHLSAEARALDRHEEDQAKGWEKDSVDAAAPEKALHRIDNQNTIRNYEARFNTPVIERAGVDSSKSVTCYAWKVQGNCSFGDEQCKYAHWNTARVSPKPGERRRGGSPVRNDNCENGYVEAWRTDGDHKENESHEREELVW